MCLTSTINKPDVLCVTEHWLQQDEKDLCKIEDYDVMSFFSRKNIQRRGSSIYPAKGQLFIEKEEIVRKSVEGHIECAVVQNIQNKTLFMCIYRTNLGISREAGRNNTTSDPEMYDVRYSNMR